MKSVAVELDRSTTVDCFKTLHCKYVAIKVVLHHKRPEWIFFPCSFRNTCWEGITPRLLQLTQCMPVSSLMSPQYPLLTSVATWFSPFWHLIAVSWPVIVRIWTQFLLQLKFLSKDSYRSLQSEQTRWGAKPEPSSLEESAIINVQHFAKLWNTFYPLCKWTWKK